MALLLLLPLLTLLTLQPPLVAPAARNYGVVLERIEGFEQNGEYVDLATSYMRIRRADKSAPPGLFHVTNITKTYPNSTEMEATIYEVHDNKIVPGWLKYKNNFCDYIEKETKPFIREPARVYQFKHCPILGMYRVENWRPDERMLPPVLPGPDRMMLGLRFYDGPTLLMKYGLVFYVDRYNKGKRAGMTQQGGRG